MTKMTKRTILLGAAAALVVALGLIAPGLAPASAERPDCPGKIECPLTGDLVCRDRCPLGAGAPADAGVPDCCKPAK
jgi:hypothetical protein